MKPKTMILMVVAVVCGLGASYMTSRLLAERDDKPAEAAPVERVKVLVAKNNMSLHFALRAKPEDFFTEKEFNKDDAPEKALTLADLPKLKGKFLKRSMRKNDHITADDLLDGKAILPSLPNGMRAFGIRVSPEQVASGFACVPGSHVDIHWTRQGNVDKDTFTKILLRDVIVLAADVNQNPNENLGAMLANVVTVALSDEDAMKLTLAIRTGTTTLVLRNMGDHSTSDVDTLTYDSLLKGNSPAPKKDEPQVAEAPKEHSRPEGAYENRGNLELPMKNEVPEKPEPPKLQKFTVTIRNGTEYQVRHYWLDEQGNIIANPQQYLEQFEQNSTPPDQGNKNDRKPKTPQRDV
jgi:pilus assembly protein CpaB